MPWQGNKIHDVCCFQRTEEKRGKRDSSDNFKDKFVTSEYDDTKDPTKGISQPNNHYTAVHQALDSLVIYSTHFSSYWTRDRGGIYISLHESIILGSVPSTDVIIERIERNLTENKIYQNTETILIRKNLSKECWMNQDFQQTKQRYIETRLLLAVYSTHTHKSKIR